METNVCQRWRDQVGTYRCARETINPAHYEVAPLPEADAKSFVVQHHYSNTFPSARFSFGLFWGGLLVGVCVFSYPVNDLVITKFLPGKAIESVELGRLVLLDRVPANAESWFVARCFELLRRESLVGVVSFSDPVPRLTVDGKTVLRGHVGTTYQALNAIYTGRGKSRTLRLLPNGQVFSERAAQKVRSGERGAEYAAAQLIAAGAPKVDVRRISDEQRREWLRSAIRLVTRALPHTGNHRYIWALNKRDRKHLMPSLVYPKFILPSDARVIVATT